MAIEFDLKTGYPDMALVPRERLGALAAEILAAGRGWQYGGDLLGIRSSREQVAHWLSEVSGAAVAPDDLMLTSGALTAIDIVARALTQPGDVVVVEDPTFYFVTHVLRMTPVELVSVPIRSDGIDLAALQAVIDQYGDRLKLLYAIPSFQNPTGFTATSTNRAALAEMTRRHNFTVIEDLTYQLLHYSEPPPPYLKTYDDSGHVITVGSVSKLLMPSLRFGWIWAQPAQIQDFKRFKDDAGSTLTAEIVAGLIHSGEMTGQVEHARQLYAGKHQRAVAALDRFAPDGLDWSAPGGGFFLWVTLPEPLTAAQVIPLAQARGVDVFAGRDAYVAPPDDRHLRICFAMLPEDAIEQGIARLCDVLREAMKAV